MRVLIAGGVGGLTTAIALRHQGIDVVNSGDTYGAVPLARIKIVEHMSGEGHIRSPLARRRSTSLLMRPMWLRRSWASNGTLG
jgi:hypothetical protein